MFNLDPSKEKRFVPPDLNKSTISNNINTHDNSILNQSNNNFFKFKKDNNLNNFDKKRKLSLSYN